MLDGHRLLGWLSLALIALTAIGPAAAYFGYPPLQRRTSFSSLPIDHHCPLAAEHSSGLTGTEPLTILPLTSETEEAAVKDHYKVCDRLKLERKQRRMCRRDPGVAETLVEAIRSSALECQYQFRFERWNCTLEGRYRSNLLQSVFKETAFLYAISSAGLTHAVAKACSAGRMERCTCDEAPDLENREAWQWGGCGDNLKFSNKFVKEFLSRKSSKDIRARMDLHNTNVGMKEPTMSYITGSDVPRRGIPGSDITGRGVTGSDMRGRDVTSGANTGSDITGSNIPGNEVTGSDREIDKLCKIHCQIYKMTFKYDCN